jgi:hypothetical protein
VLKWRGDDERVGGWGVGGGLDGWTTFLLALIVFYILYGMIFLCVCICVYCCLFAKTTECMYQWGYREGGERGDGQTKDLSLPFWV